jgi:hypothetical protein
MTEIEQHHAVFYGVVARNIYGIVNEKAKILTENEYKWFKEFGNRFVKEEKINEYDIDKPPLQIAEKIYLDDKDIFVKVTDVIRSTKSNTYIYKTDFVINTVDDEETEESKRKAEKYLTEQIDKAVIKRVSSQNKKWYQFWK